MDYPGSACRTYTFLSSALALRDRGRAELIILLSALLICRVLWSFNLAVKSPVRLAGESKSTNPEVESVNVR